MGERCRRRTEKGGLIAEKLGQNARNWDLISHLFCLTPIMTLVAGKYTDIAVVKSPDNAWKGVYKLLLPKEGGFLESLTYFFWESL